MLNVITRAVRQEACVAQIRILFHENHRESYSVAVALIIPIIIILVIPIIPY